MGEDVRSHTEAWRVYDRWLDDPRVVFLDEPTGLEEVFRANSRLRHPSPKDWADSYLAAFAALAGVCLVTFDQGFRGKIKDLILLKS